MSFELFISYSHQDEWLKDELLEHLSALKRNKEITTWHDRKIVPGAVLDAEITQKVDSSDVFVFLVSPSFVNSDYCIEQEYLRAKERHDNGEAVVVPVIVRDCHWDVFGLRDFLALPKDAKAVTENAYSKADAQQRDGKWVEVVDGIRAVVADLKKKLTPPDMLNSYSDSLFKVDFVRHPSLAEFDERLFWVDPDTYYEKTKSHFSTLSELLEIIDGSEAVVLTGPDRSGKSLLAKKIQFELAKRPEMAVLINGSKIKNADIVDLVKRASLIQYGPSSHPTRLTTVLIDDFEACTLPDAVKERIVKTLSLEFRRTLIFGFSSAPTVLFAPDDLPNPTTISILPFSDNKVYELVKKWKLDAGGSASAISDAELVRANEKISTLFNQTEAEKYPYNVVTYLELLDSALGGDIAPSSFAACYETLVQNRLINGKCDLRQIDEFKNFLSLVAYRCFQEGKAPFLSKDSFEECVELYKEQFLSSPAKLRAVSIGDFLCETASGFEFLEDYIWYFLCARYVGKRLRNDNNTKYLEFIQESCANIFQKKYANIVIYLAYFTDDNLVLRELMQLLDKLFAKAEDWRLSDKSRSIILGLASVDHLAISSSSEIDGNRAELLETEIKNIIDNAEEVVAKYTLPFIDPKFDDSELVENISSEEINGDSYTKSVNALLRTHSVIGHILNSRSGTYSAKLVVDCIEKMVQASGRYASLNHSIATLMIYEPELATKSADAVLRTQGLTDDEKYTKVMRIFAFWSVFLSQTGLARYLAQEHSMRALERLIAKHENEASDESHTPYNFTSVHLISKLYATGQIDKVAIESAVQKYGRESSLFAVLRATIHIYSYYMPMPASDKQWLSATLGIPIKALERQSLKAAHSRNFSKSKLLEFDPEGTDSSVKR